MSTVATRRPRRQPTEAQRQASAVRRARMRVLAKRVSAMPVEDRLALADRIGLRTIEGHELSPFNACMVYMQCPAASIVGGFQQWRRAGRCVRKGEHGAAIWVPVGQPRAGEEGENLPDLDDLHFVLGTVFDVCQTDAIPDKPVFGEPFPGPFGTVGQSVDWSDGGRGTLFSPAGSAVSQ